MSSRLDTPITLPFTYGGENLPEIFKLSLLNCFAVIVRGRGEAILFDYSINHRFTARLPKNIPVITSDILIMKLLAIENYTQYLYRSFNKERYTLDYLLTKSVYRDESLIGFLKEDCSPEEIYLNCSVKFHNDGIEHRNKIVISADSIVLGG